MKTATEVLRDEHVLILRALDLAETAAARLASGSGPADEWWSALVAWLRGFADRNHHAKEEQALFPAMASAGVPTEGGPIGVMLDEHVEGRALIRAIESGTADGRAKSARRYVELLRAHIDKENGVLFAIADAVLDDRAQQTLGAAFETMADQLGAEASIAHAESALETLAAGLTVLAAR